jgi:geranylgeranyl pyrophosphate synthase
MTDIESFLAAVETQMRAEIARTSVAAPARRLLDAGGKRLRARLLWWSANAATRDPLHPHDPSLIRAATAIEFAHLGSLIHDDIVDGGDTRRGVSTLHRELGIGVATDAGAALAHLANELVATLGNNARRAVRRALLATCRGQVRELAVPFVMVPPRVRLAIMQEKTGAFFELAAALGAQLSGATATATSAVRRYARRFGVAFQIADDVLDLAGDPRELGRANGADLRDGVLTLPVLLAADPEGKLQQTLMSIRRSPDAETIASCAATIEEGGGVTAATSVAAWWLNRALDALQPLPGGHGVAELVRLARTSVERGLRPGLARFGTTPPSRSSATMPHSLQLIAMPAASYTHSAGELAPALALTLEWFHPGLSTMVTSRAQAPSVRRGRSLLRRYLRGGDTWSGEAEIAADAIALAHALADDEALRDDAVRTLALIDALHCAAIASLNASPSALEHERLAARARNLGQQQPSPTAHAPRSASHLQEQSTTYLPA